MDQEEYETAAPAMIEAAQLAQANHDDLVARGGRYKEMFELQAARFDDPEEEDEVLDTLS